MARKYAMNSRTNASGETPAQRSCPSPLTDRALSAKARTIWANIHTSRRRRSLSTLFAVSSSKTPRASSRAPSDFAHEHDRVLQRRAQVRGEAQHRGTQLVRARGQIDRGEIPLEGATHLEAQVRRDALERRLDVPQLVASREQRFVLAGQLARGDPEAVGVESVGEQRPRAPAQVAGECPRVGAKDAEHQVHDAPPSGAENPSAPSRPALRARGSGASGTARAASAPPDAAPARPAPSGSAPASAPW